MNIYEIVKTFFSLCIDINSLPPCEGACISYSYEKSCLYCEVTIPSVPGTTLSLL